MKTSLIAVTAVLGLGLGTTAQAQESASTFNANPFKPTNGALPYECIAPASGAPVTSYFFSGTADPYTWQGLTWGSDEDAAACPAGTLRVARWERFAVGGATAYVLRGGGGGNTAEVFGNTGVRFGHVLASSLAKQTSVLTAYIPGKVGAAPASCTGKVFANRPEKGTTAELSRLFTKRSQASGSGAKWDNYGDQAGSGPKHYSYLLWTWPALPIVQGGGRNAGGGQIRAVLESGQHIRACDVSPVLLPMYPAGAKTSAGEVKLYYGRVSGAGRTVYGWFAQAWHRNGRGWHYFVA